MTGKIVKAISGFYYIEFENKIYECRAKGILKKNNISPMVGDKAEFEEIGQNVGNLIRVIDRKNSLIRPPVANIDKVVIVVAVKNPEPSLLFIDKQLVFLEKMKIPATICLNKVDIGETQEIKGIYENQKRREHLCLRQHKYLKHSAIRKQPRAVQKPFSKSD